MIERGTRDTKQATRGCGTHPAHELRNRDTAGHLSRFVPLCPAVSRGSPATPHI